MSYSISPSEDGNYIVVKTVGDFTRQLALQSTIEAHALGRELGIKCYLVDVTESRNIESVVTNYEFGYRDIRSTPEIDETAHVAVLVAEGDQSHDFYETIAHNAGLNLTLFTDRELAIQHLLKD